MTMKVAVSVIILQPANPGLVRRQLGRRRLHDSALPPADDRLDQKGSPLRGSIPQH
jgi:hypothetical protein